jgi:hypothetical protein
VTAVSSPVEWEAKCRALLAETYTPEGVEIYMHARNRQLAFSTPVELIEHGNGAMVYRVIERIELGG